MIGSKTARSLPTSTMLSAKSSEIAPKRCTSAFSRPRVFTTEGGVEGLMSDLGHLGSKPLGAGGGDTHPPLIEDVGERDRRPHGKANDGQEGIGEDQKDSCDCQHDDHTERHGERCRDEGCGLHVGIHVRQELTRGVTSMPLDRQFEVPIGNVGAVSLLEPGTAPGRRHSVGR